MLHVTWGSGPGGSNVDRLVLAMRHTVFKSGNTVNKAYCTSGEPYGELQQVNTPPKRRWRHHPSFCAFRSFLYHI